MLARELAGERVEVAHPLHGDEERLVVREAGLVQLGDLAAKVILELVDVAAVHAGRARDVRPPLRDLRLHALHQASTAASRQTSFSARVTVSHCRCWSASAARPSLVIT